MPGSADHITPTVPARYRPTMWAVVHYVLWTALIVLLWPVALLFTTVERLLHHD